MPWGTSASNTLKINKITIISFFTLCRNTTISFHNFVELIGVAERNAIVVIWIALKINKIQF